MSAMDRAHRGRPLLLPAVLAVAVAVGLWAVRVPLADWFTGARPEPETGALDRRAAAAGAGAGRPDDVDHYTCTMHPSVRLAAPGQCPICGMELVPVTRGQQLEGIVRIDEGRRQLIGVRTGPVVEAPMRGVVRAVGQVAYDESGLTDVSLKVKGWITHLYVDKTGQRVARGQPLVAMYSPDLYGAEQDFLLSTRAEGEPATGEARSASLAGAARSRLRLLGLSDAQIEALAKRGAPDESVTFPAPASGFVVEKDVVEGASVEQGMRLFRIASLDRVWIEAEVYEADLPRVRVGQPATVTLDYVPGRGYDARVAYVYPYVDPKARTGRVRLELPNAGLDLRPGMYAKVALAYDLGPRVQVPASAVVYTGPRRLVFLDLGDGRFRPREVQLGVEAGDAYEVVSGLQAGDAVATSGVFLIAAEARIATAAGYWDSAADGGDAAASDGAAPQGAVYTCPMHPEVQSPVPGVCPKCGMTLVPRGSR
jgi:Cu(I)/Ag(I) efflux system membrane fusion protein